MTALISALAWPLAYVGSLGLGCSGLGLVLCGLVNITGILPVKPPSIILQVSFQIVIKHAKAKGVFLFRQKVVSSEMVNAVFVKLILCIPF